MTTSLPAPPEQRMRCPNKQCGHKVFNAYRQNGRIQIRCHKCNTPCMTSELPKRITPAPVLEGV